MVHATELFTFEHSIQFMSGDATLPFRSTGWWKTARGALRAAERHASRIEAYYNREAIKTHALVIRNDRGEFVTNEAA